MAKEHGLGAGLLVGGYDFTGDVIAVGNISGGPRLTDQPTGIDKLAFERLGLTRDGKLSGTTWFNPSAGMGHKRLSALPTADVQAQYWHRQAIARPVACIVAKQANYDGTRAQDGSFTFEWEFAGNAFGLEWCTGLTAFKRTDTGATNGTSVDFTTPAFTGSSTFGLQAYAQLFAFTGTSITLTIEDSADNSAWAALTGGAFAAMSAIGDQRIQTGRTQTVRRYLRVTSSGTFTNAVFAVAVARNDVSTVF